MTQDRLTESSPPGWYECLLEDGERMRPVVRWWDGQNLRHEPHDLICKTDRYSNFKRLQASP